MAHLSSRPSLAIIDDYLNTSPSHFTQIPHERLQITTFNDSIIPASDAEVARLAERLQPVDLISTTRDALPSQALYCVNYPTSSFC